MRNKNGGYNMTFGREQILAMRQELARRDDELQHELCQRTPRTNYEIWASAAAQGLTVWRKEAKERLSILEGKGNALDGFCKHARAYRAVEQVAFATREDPGEEIDFWFCPDCGATIGQIGVDFSSFETNNRHEPELDQVPF